MTELTLLYMLSKYLFSWVYHGLDKTQRVNSSHTNALCPAIFKHS